MVLKEYKRCIVAKDKECIFDENILELSRKARYFEENLIDCYIDQYIPETRSQLNESDKELLDLYSDGNSKTGKISQLLGIEPHTFSMRKNVLKKSAEI